MSGLKKSRNLRLSSNLFQGSRGAWTNNLEALGEAMNLERIFPEPGDRWQFDLSPSALSGYQVPRHATFRESGSHADINLLTLLVGATDSGTNCGSER